jgi:putative nucleotidyltransferase with HDIG domain
MKNKFSIKKHFAGSGYFNFAALSAMALAVFLIATGATSPARYRIAVGQKSDYDISAPFDMIDAVQTERYANSAAAAVAKAYEKNPDKVNSIINKTESFGNMVLNEHKVYRDTLGINASGGVGTDAQLLLDQSVTRLAERAVEFGAPISREQASAILSDVSQAQLAAFMDKVAAKIASSAELEITQDNINNRIVALQNSIQTEYANQNLKNMASMFVQSALSVNVDEDAEKMGERQNDAYMAAFEHKRVIAKGDRILSMDDRVTADQMALLQSYGLVDTGKADIHPIVKLAAVLACLTALLLLFVSRFCGKALASRKQLLMLVCLITLVLLLCRLVYPFQKLALPVYMAPILVAYLLGLHVALAAHAYIVVVISMFAGMDIRTLLVFALGGTLAALLSYSAAQRSRLTWAALVLSVVNAALLIAFADSFADISAYYMDVLTLFFTSLMSALLSLGLIALSEGIFNTATPLRLTELSSGNTELLRQLSFKAPGTHHHSLMVGYMAEEAARDIDANPFVARAGALYHDVGKMACPEFFTENQSGANPHDELPPEESARIIISHTGEGLAMCARGKLPQPVLDIVKEHHGDTPVIYFYKKAQKMYGEGNVPLDDYRYPGPRPTSRESAIVLLADSCEAAVRSAGQKGESDIAAWVEKIVKQKLDDGQLDNSEITIHDLNKIKRTFTRVLSGYYHTRVRYPEEQRGARRQEAGAGEGANAGSVASAGSGMGAGLGANAGLGSGLGSGSGMGVDLGSNIGLGSGSGMGAGLGANAGSGPGGGRLEA